ncbi:MAG: hypothetical protein IJ492_01670 [Clostridia bacterium]|nr:hypothetical protein [Clostridia bacterium]MBQ8504948.1 hypothetical protein [Clostridia bacterium]
MKLIPISNDLFNIVNRLKSINPNYQVYFNKELCRFEVHCSTQYLNTLAVIVPYDQLDARTVSLVEQSRTEHAERIFRQLDYHNQLVEKHAVDDAVNNGMASIERALSKGEISL